jgi:hypothetical protein
MFITGVNDTGDKVYCTSVSMTPAINSCHGFSVIAGVVETGDKFLIGVNEEKNLKLKISCQTSFKVLSG